MSQFPPQPPPPYTPPASATLPPKRSRGSLFGWVLFICLAITIFLLLQHRGVDTTRGSFIPLSEFTERLDASRVARVVVERDEVYGELFAAPVLPNVDASTFRSATRGTRLEGTRFRVALPNGMGESWGFMEWLLAHRHDATIFAQNDSGNYVLNILLPIVPWLLIFGFIWFFVFRQMRRSGAVTVPLASPFPPPTQQ